MLTPAPTSCTGGSMIGPRNSGSSPTGSEIERTPAPNTSVATPRISEASPIVAMITATIGRPSSLRSTTRSRPKQKAIMPISESAAASQNGSAAPIAAAAMMAASITNSPCAKLIASVAL